MYQFAKIVYFPEVQEQMSRVSGSTGLYICSFTFLLDNLYYDQIDGYRDQHHESA